MEWADISNYLANIVGPLVVGFLIGRIFQKWDDGTMEAEDGAYRVGYEEGFRDGIHNRRDPHGKIAHITYWNQR